MAIFKNETALDAASAHVHWVLSRVVRFVIDGSQAIDRIDLFWLDSLGWHHALVGVRIIQVRSYKFDRYEPMALFFRIFLPLKSTCIKNVIKNGKLLKLLTGKDQMDYDPD